MKVNCLLFLYLIINILPSKSPLHLPHRLFNLLVIDVGRRGDCIVVQNNLNPLKSSMPATGTGLQTLCDRYSMIYGKEISVVKTENSFIVELPLIPKDYESADN